jgi:hypothetical protein
MTSTGQMEWVLKSDISLQALVENFSFDYGSMHDGPWIVNYNTEEEEAPVQDDRQKTEEEAYVQDDQSIDDEWDFHNGVSVEATGECDPSEDWYKIYFLGFHPFKEIAFLWVAERAISYHLNTSKVQELGILPVPRPVRLAYQPTASSTFLSQQTSNQPAVLFSQNKPAPAISHQPTEQAARPRSFISIHSMLI